MTDSMLAANDKSVFWVPAVSLTPEYEVAVHGFALAEKVGRDPARIPAHPTGTLSVAPAMGQLTP